MSPSIDRIERAGYLAWSPEETASINGWSLVSNGGFTRRLNSATARGAADTSLQTRDAIVAWLADRSAPMTLRVTPLIDPDTVAACEGTWGLESVDETYVMTRLLPSDRDAGGVEFVDAGDESFVDELFALNGRTSSVRRQWQGIVERTGSSATGLRIQGDAVGFVAVSDGIASLFSVAVRPSVRRQGVATRIMDAAFVWAVERNAETMGLQVLGTNEAARKLYRKLGFVDAYTYRYLQPKGRTSGVA